MTYYPDNTVEKNIVRCTITIESGCDASEGEYGLYISGFLGALDVCSLGGVDDISLIKEAIENDFDFEKLPEEGGATINLVETGEWEDVFWHKCYQITSVSFFEP